MCPDYPYLAATLDGLVGDEVVVKMKWSFTGRNEMIDRGQCFHFWNVILVTQHSRDPTLTLTRGICLSKVNKCETSLCLNMWT